MHSGNFKESYAELIVLSDSAATWAWTGALLLALVALPAFVGGYALTLVIGVMIAAIGAIGLTLLTGTTGLVSLGQSGFLAIGAYANAILIADHGWPVWAALPAAGLIAGLASLLVGIPSLRLKRLYLAITTLAFSFIVTYVILYAEGLTHGPNGIFLSKLRVLGLNLSRDRDLYWLVLGMTVLLTLAALNLLRSRVGRAWLAIRDHDIAARVMGIDLTRWKLYAFFVSSFYVGIAGALLSLQIRFINVDVFDILLSIEALAMIILGGLGSVPGAILGAAFLTLLPEAIRLVFAAVGGVGSSFYSEYVFQIRGIAYGVVIVAFLRFEPDGLMGLWRDIRRYWTNWPMAY
jgi:branched-chain amino acid transport system permease protein